MTISLLYAKVKLKISCQSQDQFLGIGIEAQSYIHNNMLIKSHCNHSFIHAQSHHAPDMPVSKTGSSIYCILQKTRHQKL